MISKYFEDDKRVLKLIITSNILFVKFWSNYFILDHHEISKLSHYLEENLRILIGL